MDMDIDDVFKDDMKNLELNDMFYDENDRIDRDLNKIFKQNGYLKQLTELTINCCDLISLSTKLKADGVCESTDDSYKKLIKKMASINTIIETFVVSDGNVVAAIESDISKYISEQLDTNKVDILTKPTYTHENTNRLKYFFNDDIDK